MNVSVGITPLQLNKYLQGSSSPVSIEWALVNTPSLFLAHPSLSFSPSIDFAEKQTDWLIYHTLVGKFRRYLGVCTAVERKDGMQKIWISIKHSSLNCFVVCLLYLNNGSFRFWVMNFSYFIRSSNRTAIKLFFPKLFIFSATDHWTK